MPTEQLGAGFRWIVTSPPYYGMRTYVSDQWLRAWFLGGPPQVTYSSEHQFGHQSPEDFSAQLACVWRRIAAVAAPSARMVVRFGGIHDRSADPRGIFLSSVKEANGGWQVKTSVGAGSAGSGRRQAGQFGRHLRAAIEERDYHLTIQQ